MKMQNWLVIAHGIPFTYYDYKYAIASFKDGHDVYRMDTSKGWLDMIKVEKLEDITNDQERARKEAKRCQAVWNSCY